MLEFCGQETCRLDANGRFKLSAGILRDFERHSDGALILFCLPEGALGLYPPAVWESMRSPAEAPGKEAGHSMLMRRSMRRFGAFTQRVELTRQGRITVPTIFREHAGIDSGEQIVLLGVEIGAEIWKPDRWKQELAVISDHMVRKGDEELKSDLGGDQNV